VAVTPERQLAARREWGVRNRDKIKILTLWSHHGLRPHDWAAMWDEQGGLCYLCGEPMTADKATVEHDHSCCGPMRSCPLCRRGLAHQPCNSAIGHAGDDPDRLRRMADALEAAQRGVAERMTSREYEQFPLL
jgi:hypothetical protein